MLIKHASVCVYIYKDLYIHIHKLYVNIVLYTLYILLLKGLGQYNCTFINNVRLLFKKDAILMNCIFIKAFWKKISQFLQKYKRSITVFNNNNNNTCFLNTKSAN